MTTETILTDPMVSDLAWEYATGILEVRAIEQAVLQSDHIRNMQGMADCMAMVRQEFIEAGVINESVPPMMVANAVLFEIQALRKNSIGWRHIETAPQQGRRMILLLTPSRFPQVAWSDTWWLGGFSVENKPTHWMPLPELPDSAAMEQQK